MLRNEEFSSFFKEGFSGTSNSVVSWQFKHNVLDTINQGLDNSSLILYIRAFQTTDKKNWNEIVLSIRGILALVAERVHTELI